MYSRRDLLKLLMGTAAAEVLDLEKMLWVPGAKTIFVPPANVWKELDFVLKKYYVPVLIDSVFKSDPLFTLLKSRVKLSRAKMGRAIKTGLYVQ